MTVFGVPLQPLVVHASVVAVGSLVEVALIGADAAEAAETEVSCTDLRRRGEMLVTCVLVAP